MEYAQVEAVRHTPITHMSATGYGRKLRTPYEVQLTVEGGDRKRKKWRRVWATCFSNSPSFWIIAEGKELIVDELDLQNKLIN